MRFFPNMHRFSTESRTTEQRAKIASVHMAMATKKGVVGKLARLYDQLVQSAPHNEALRTTHNFQHARDRAMYIGGIALDAFIENEVQVTVDLRRYTTIHTANEHNYTEIGIFVSDQEASRIRGRLRTDLRQGRWVMDGTASPGGSAYTSVKAPALNYPEGFGVLVDSVVRLVATVCPEVAPQALPSARDSSITQQ